MPGVAELVPLSDSSGPQSKQSGLLAPVTLTSSLSQAFLHFFDVPHPSLHFQSKFICDWFRPICSCINAALVLQFFPLPEVTTGTYSPFHKPNTFTVCTSNLPNGFSLPLLSLFLPNTSYRIMHATSYDVYRPYRMTSTLLQENEKSLPKHCPHLPFSQLRHHSSSVLWRLNCTTAPSPS